MRRLLLFLLVAVFALGFVPEVNAKAKKANKAPSAKKAKKSKKANSANPKKFFFFKKKTAWGWDTQVAA